MSAPQNYTIQLLSYRTLNSWKSLSWVVYSSTGVIKSRYFDVSNIEITKRIYIFRLLLLSFASFPVHVFLLFSLEQRDIDIRKKIKMMEFYGVKEKGLIVRMNIVGDLNAWIEGISEERQLKASRRIYRS